MRAARFHRGRAPAIACAAALAVATLHSQPGAPAGPSGLREPAWSPDSRRLAVVFLDRLWTIGPDGNDPRPLTSDDPSVQRDPAWSPDGRRIAYSADAGGGFDIYVLDLDARGRRSSRGVPVRVTALPGDERGAAWTPDGRLVFSHRPTGAPQWDLYVTASGSGGWDQPERLTDTADDEVQPRVSPDGRRLAFASNRDSDDGDFDISILRLPAPGEHPARAAFAGQDALGELASVAVRRPLATRLVQARGLDGYPAWSPEGDRLAFYGVRDGIGATWVAPVDPLPQDESAGLRVARVKPSHPPQLVSRRGGSVAWSPDGRTLAIGGLPDPDPMYNGNPHRDPSEPPPMFALGRAYQLWTVPAPRPVDEGTRTVAPPDGSASGAFVQAFDRVWSTLARMYYREGEGAAAWTALRSKYRPRAEGARSERALEEITDGMLGEAPLIKPAIVSSRAVVVSGHPLASEAGRAVLEKGGNIVDAMIAVSFALGVVEPDASGIGGDGQAVLYLKGMREPVVVEYKDQTPMRATLDNPRIFRNGRLVADGPAAANIPGVVAGMDHLFRRYGSGRLTWAELIQPAIAYADEGFVLDEALPSTVSEGRRYLEKYPEAARVYLPGGRLPRPGERFANRDYANTLRVLAGEGADAFYRGSIARRIAADMEANGGIITLDDLAQYHAVERRPVAGRYRGHVLFTGGPPVGSGVALLEALQILDNYPRRAGATPSNDADYWHHVIEAWKVRDPIRRIADPGLWPVDYEQHLQRAHAANLFRKIDPARAMRYPDQADEGEAAPSRIGSGTTAFVVADVEGNMIAVTQTLSTWGGAFYVSRDLGFLYNNHLRSNRTARGAYAQLLPLMRSNTTSVPTLVFRERGSVREPRLALGAAGNAWIPASAYSIIAAVLDGGLSMQRAIEAPRFLVSRDPADPLGTAARVEIEDRFPRPVLEELMTRGHRFHKVGRKGEVRYGYAAAALVHADARRVEGGSEPRRSHLAVAVGGPPSLTQPQP